MTWVKICGITNLEDAEIAVDAGADAVGFVFYEKSPRNVSPDVAREIVARLPARVEKVGVFVNGSSEQLRRRIEEANLTGAQLHTELTRSSSLMAELNGDCKVYPVLSAGQSLGGSGSFESLKKFQSSSKTHRSAAIFLDSGNLEQPGGTGKVFDWEKATPLAQEIKNFSKLVVAGGLTPDNVAEAMRILKPWGVDVSSGVESRPGKKDPEKVRAFISAVRTADKRA